MIDFISLYHLYIIGLLVLLCGVSVFFMIKFALVVLNTEQKLTDILDAIDDEYTEITKVLEKPVFFDSVEIRQVIASIENVRHTFLNISNYIIEDFKDENNEEKNEKVSN